MNALRKIAGFDKKRRSARRVESLSLLDRLRQQDNRMDSERHLDPWIHVSDLIKHCHRYVALCKIHGVMPDRPRGADRVVWAMGKAAEKHVVYSLIESFGKENVLGKWSCVCGATTYQGVGQHTKCKTCSTNTDKYYEFEFRDLHRMVVGRADFIYRCPETNQWKILEIKSINKREYDELDAPKSQHVAQLSAYFAMAKPVLPDLSPSGGVLYVCKDYIFAGSIYKLFEKTLEDSLTYSLASSLLVDAKAINDAVNNNGPLPPRLPACSSIDSPKAAKCKKCAECFANTTQQQTN